MLNYILYIFFFNLEEVHIAGTKSWFNFVENNHVRHSIVGVSISESDAVEALEKPSTLTGNKTAVIYLRVS